MPLLQRVALLIVAAVIVPLTLYTPLIFLAESMAILWLGQVLAVTALLTSLGLGAGTLIVTRVFTGSLLAIALAVYVAGAFVALGAISIGIACHYGRCL